MDIVFLLVGIFLVFGLVVLFPMLISFLNRHDKRLKFLFLIPIAFLAYSIYTAIYPTDKFYKHDFKEVTGIEFPEDGEILYKTADFPDHFGDYTSVSLVRVNNQFFNNLPNELQKKGLTENQDRIGTEEFDKALLQLGSNKIHREFSAKDGSGVYYYVGFLTDNETLIINRTSW